MAKQKGVLVIEVFPDGLADLAGIQPGDRLVEIGGECLEGGCVRRLDGRPDGIKEQRIEFTILCSERRQPVQAQRFRRVGLGFGHGASPVNLEVANRLNRRRRSAPSRGS